MNEQEFQQLEARVKEGEPLGALERFIYDREAQRRASGPNILQQQAADRAENALLKNPTPQLMVRAGLSRRKERKVDDPMQTG